jgi:hypothetical protein
VESAEAGAEHEGLRVVRGPFFLQLFWVKLIFALALQRSQRPLDAEVMRQDAFNELSFLFHVLDLSSKLKEKVVFASLALDLGYQNPEALDLVFQKD